MRLSGLRSERPERPERPERFGGFIFIIIIASLLSEHLWASSGPLALPPSPNFSSYSIVQDRDTPIASHRTPSTKASDKRSGVVAIGMY